MSDNSTKRGGYKRPDRTANPSKADNAKYINFSLRLVDLPKVDITSTEQVNKRVREYFEICAADDMKPSVAGLALALDISRNHLWEIREGKSGKNPEVSNTLKKAMAILDAQMVEYMQNGKINPASGIFLMKNNFGYKDEQKITVEPQSPLGDSKNLEQLAEQYKTAAIDTGAVESGDD